MNTNTKHWASITAGILSLAGYSSAAEIGSEKYTYDASGNIVEKSIDGRIENMSYNASNHLVSRSLAGGGEKISYDASGRPVTYRDESGKISRRLSYAYSDKVTVVGNSSELVCSEFLYNAEGLLVGKNSNGNFESFAWDGTGLVMRGEKTFANEKHLAGGVPTLANKDVAVTDFLGSTLSMGNKSFEATAFGGGVEEGRFVRNA